MRRARLLLLPLGTTGELLLLALCWLLALVAPRAAGTVSDWVVNTLPGPQWYFGQDAKPSTAGDDD